MFGSWKIEGKKIREEKKKLINYFYLFIYLFLYKFFLKYIDF